MNNLLNEDAEEASFSLNGMLAGFDENTSAYAHMPTKNPNSHFCFALNIKMTEEEVIPALKDYLAELEQGVCREVLCIEKKMLEKEYWQKGGLLRRNLQAMRERLESKRIIAATLKVQNCTCFDDLIERLEDSYAEVARLLGEIAQKVKKMKMPQRAYGQFYQYLKSQYDAEHAMTAYDEWMMKEGDYSFKTLKGKQTKEVAEFLRKDLLQHLRKPLQNEIDEVDVDKVIYWMPCDYDREYLLSKDFKMQCARFRWNISWEDDILKFDYDALGEYLFKNYYKMTDKERQAFFDLDVMVELINRDIAKVMPVEEEEEVMEDSRYSSAKEKIISYVDRLEPMVRKEFRDNYYELWNGILDLKEVKESVYDKGKQQGTTFNRNLVAQIIRQIKDKVYVTTANTVQMAECLEPGKGASHPVRQKLGEVPCRMIKKSVEEYMNTRF